MDGNKKMKIISKILSLSLIFLISCDKDPVSSDEDSFSIVGTWNIYGRSYGQTNWYSSNSTYTFNSDGTYVNSYDGGSSNGTYFFCETSNVIQWNDVSFNGDCNCKDTSTISSTRYTIEGTNTIYISECNDSFQWMKMVKL